MSGWITLKYSIFLHEEILYLYYYIKKLGIEVFVRTMSGIRVILLI